MDKLEQFQIEFKANACFRLDESMRMVRITLNNISEEELWKKPNSSLNSIGNLILHVCGNLAQYGITSLAETEDYRNREVEFATTEGFNKQELLTQLSETVNTVKSTIYNVDTIRLLDKQHVQGFEFSGIGNIIHVVEHFSYHTGQIAFWVKQLNNEQLGFYDGMDLNIKNQE